VDVYSGLINQRGKELLYSIVHDITTQKKSEIALIASEELFRLIFDQSPLGSVITSLDYTPLQINDAFSDILGYSKKELSS
jgi:PAS domain-containing protein